MERVEIPLPLPLVGAMAGDLPRAAQRVTEAVAQARAQLAASRAPRRLSVHGASAEWVRDDVSIAEVPAPAPDVTIERMNEALQQARGAYVHAFAEAGLSEAVIALLQSWVDLQTSTRVTQLQAELQAREDVRPASTGGEPAAPRSTNSPWGDPVAPLSAAELGAALKVSDQTVRARERAGELFSILRPARKRGVEYPAFQAWPGIAGEPLAKTLAALGAGADPTGATGVPSSTLAYAFFTSRTELLGGLTPIEVLLGQLTTARAIDADDQALLDASAAERLEVVVNAARATAAVDAA
jgi:hypothetical protein